MGSSVDTPARDKKQEIKDAPAKFRDPITGRIMLEPVMVLSSEKVYEKETIEKWIESEHYYDPLTGIPLCETGWPLLLQPRNDLRREMTKFFAANPVAKRKFEAEVAVSDVKLTDMFGIYNEQVQQKHHTIQLAQDNLKRKSERLFRQVKMDKQGETVQLIPDTSDMKSVELGSVGIEYNDSVILLPTIPIVCFMGPSRNGKSTIVNDIIRVRNACKISQSSNVAQTKGVWIAKCSSHTSHTSDDEKGVDEGQEAQEAQEFYVLDMEGLSHDVSQMTKMFFYACYAASNVVIWNDKEVASERFRRLMKELKKEMEQVASSDTKPSFIYLKRDGGDFSFSPHPSFDEYINKHDSFQWLRDMNIFSSLSAYEIERPSKHKGELPLDVPLNFTTPPQNRKLLDPFIRTVMKKTQGSTRFCANMVDLKQQIRHINHTASLSLTGKLIADNPFLRHFVWPPLGHVGRRKAMTLLSRECEWDHVKLNQMVMKELKELREKAGDSVSETELQEIVKNKDKLCKRIKNKMDNKEYSMDVGLKVGISVFGVLMALAAAAKAVH